MAQLSYQDCLRDEPPAVTAGGAVMPSSEL
jgi:hypothetical protein